MAKVETSVLVEHEGSAWLGEWTQYPPYARQDGQIAPHCYLVIYQVVYGVKVPISDLETSYYKWRNVATSCLVEKRIRQVRSQLFPTGDENVDEVIDLILEKVRDGEWMGQRTHNQEFTIYEFAPLLGVTEGKAMELAEELQANGKVMLAAGDIIIPCAKD